MKKNTLKKILRTIEKDAMHGKLVESNPNPRFCNIHDVSFKGMICPACYFGMPRKGGM